MKYLFKSASASGNPVKFIYEVGDPNAEVVTLESLGLDMTKPEDILFAHNNEELLTEEARMANINEFKDGRPPKNFQAEMVGISRKAAIEMDKENPEKKKSGVGYLDSLATWSGGDGVNGDTKTKFGDLELDLCKKIARGYVEKFVKNLEVDTENLVDREESFINILAKHIQSQFKDRLFKRDAYGDKDDVGFLFWKDAAIVEGIEAGVQDAIIHEGYTVTPHLSKKQIEELKKRKEERKNNEAEKTKQFYNEFSKIVEKTLPDTQIIINKVS